MTQMFLPTVTENFNVVNVSTSKLPTVSEDMLSNISSMRGIGYAVYTQASGFPYILFHLQLV